VKWLVINTESFSPAGLKKKKDLGFGDLPWVVRKFLSAFSSPFIILDECFVAGTPVTCIEGNNKFVEKCIDFVQVGDRIYNAIGEDYVASTKRKEVKSLVEISAGGRTVACSEDHRFFTVRGWKPAKHLRAGDYLVATAEAVRLLREGVCSGKPCTKMGTFLREKLLREMADARSFVSQDAVYAGEGKKGIRQAEEVLCRGLGGCKEADRANTGIESDVEQKGRSGNDSDESEKWHAAKQGSRTGRQREAASAAGNLSIARPWQRLASRIRSFFRQEEKRLSDKLQNRYCEFEDVDRRRSRWRKPCREPQTFRFKKGQDARVIRVDNVTVYQQGNPGLDKYRGSEGRIYCYDIKAVRHPSFSVNGFLVHNCSKIKTNTPMRESDKSSRTRTIKLLNKFGDRMIMTGTLMSKSPLNVIDPYNFLQDGYFPESMWDFAEKHCVMVTLRASRGRRVLISQKDYAEVRKYLKNAFIRGGELQLEAAKYRVHKNLGIDYAKIEHIIQHRRYSPFLNRGEIMRRIAKDTIFVKRSDIFDTRHEKFIHEPIKKPVELSDEAKRIAASLIDLGFTDKLVLGKAPALELLIRLQDVCNGFEPVEKWEGEARAIEYRPLAENSKLEALMELLEEIGTEENQVAIFSSRTKMLDAACQKLQSEGIAFARYDGSASDKEKEEAEESFEKGEARAFCANPSSAAYGLNCLAKCSYLIWLCIDGSVEKEYQARHRLLRGELAEPKIAYAIYVKGSVEERQWEALRVGQELIGAENYKETFMVA